MTIAARVREYICQNLLFGSDEHISDDASLIDAGVIDSTGVMELVSFLETEFEIEVHDRDLVPENLDSIAAITSFLMRSLAEKQQTNRSAPTAARDGAC